MLSSSNPSLTVPPFPPPPWYMCSAPLWLGSPPWIQEFLYLPLSLSILRMLVQTDNRTTRSLQFFSLVAEASRVNGCGKSCSFLCRELCHFCSSDVHDVLAGYLCCDPLSNNQCTSCNRGYHMMRINSLCFVNRCLLFVFFVYKGHGNRLDKW